jgi:hypothetical protein
MDPGTWIDDSFIDGKLEKPPVEAEVKKMRREA